jgi:hypothetical protein
MPLDGAEVGAEKPNGSAGKVTPKARLRTLEDLDARTRARKRAEEMRQKLIEDAGAENLSHADLMRIDQTVFMSAVIEDMHVRALTDGKIDRASLATLVNTCSRNLDAVTARSDSRKPRTLKLDEGTSRDLARAVLDVLRTADVVDAPAPDAEPAQLAPPLPAAHTDSEGPQEPAPEPPENPTGVYAISETETDTQLSNGARLVGIPDAHGDLTRWQPIDLRGMRHRTFTDRTDATEFAKTLEAIVVQDHSEGPHYTINGAEIDPHEMGGIPHECRESFFQQKRPRVIRSRRQL